MPVVSNTSPIWNLASIERLDLLHDQFLNIRIPDEVWQELQVGLDHSTIFAVTSAGKWMYGGFVL